MGATWEAIMVLVQILQKRSVALCFTNIKGLEKENLVTEMKKVNLKCAIEEY